MSAYAIGVRNHRLYVTAIPDDGRCAIEYRFQRIADELTARWRKSEIDAYLNRLLIDDRGNRRGFPDEVLEELMFLSSLRWQITHPQFSRADEGLVEQFSCMATPVLDPPPCATTKGWVWG